MIFNKKPLAMAAKLESGTFCRGEQPSQSKSTTTEHNAITTTQPQRHLLLVNIILKLDTWADNWFRWPILATHCWLRIPCLLRLSVLLMQRVSRFRPIIRLS